MKVSVIYSGGLNAPNGASKVVKMFKTYRKFFKRNGINIQDIFCSNNKPSASFISGSLSKSKNINSNIKKVLAKTTIGSIISIYLQYFRNSGKAIKKYKQSLQDEDLIIFHEIISCWIYLKKIPNNRKKIILVLHTNGDTWKMLYEYFPKVKRKIYLTSFLEKMEKCVYQKVERIVFVSKTSKELFVKNNPALRSKVTFIYNGIDDKNSRPPISNFDKIRLITVGSLNSRKAQHLILAALAKFPKKDVCLSLVGGGDKFEDYYQYAEECKLLDRVTFWGNQDNVEEILCQHNVFILSSKDEGLPIAILEAMKHSLPIIATDVGGICELIKGNGILIKPDINSIIKALEEIYINRESLVNMSRVSHDLFHQSFSINKMIEKYSDLISEVLNE